MVPAPVFRHELETPLPLQAVEGSLRLVGWCVAEGVPEPPDVKLSTAAGDIPLTRRVDRPDVVAALGLPASRALYGFVLSGELPAGAHRASLLAARSGSGEWQLLREFALIVPNRAMQASVEWPLESVVRESIRIQGWCAHPEVELAEVWLHYGNHCVPCDYGLPRADVPSFLPRSPNASRAGFIAKKNIPAGFGPLRIRAVSTSGELFFAFPSVTVDVSRDEDHPDSIDLRGGFATLGPARRSAASAGLDRPQKPAGRRILFVLYGDLTSNSALHVAALADALMERGHECVVAIPHHPDTVRYHRTARFRTVLFEEFLRNPEIFTNGRPAEIVHAWTTRENVRRFCATLRSRASFRLVVHLEDHELRILETHTKQPLERLLALPKAELDALVPEILSHPRRSRGFLESADAATVVIERLRELVPAGKPAETIWPAADASCFFPRPIPWAVREALGWGSERTILFYHGNVHPTNAAEVRELYLAVALLNESGCPTTLIRTGRDFGDFLVDLAPRAKPYVLALGKVDHHAHLPPLMALADFFVQPGEADTFNDYRFPSKLPEFFALGRPVILPRTNLGELLRHGEDAWVLARADGVAIAEAVKMLRKDAALRERLGSGAARVSRTYFDWQRSADTLLAFYNKLLSAG